MTKNVPCQVLSFSNKITTYATHTGGHFNPLRLQSDGSDFNSAKYLSRHCKSWNVYLQGYLHHTAPFSRGWVIRRLHTLCLRWALDELLEENIEGQRNTAETSQTYWFSVTLFHNRRHYLVKETYPSPPRLPPAQGPVSSQLCIDNGSEVFAVTSVSICIAESDAGRGVNKKKRHLRL